MIQTADKVMSALEWCRVHHPERIYEWNLRKMESYAQYRIDNLPKSLWTDELVEQYENYCWNISSQNRQAQPMTPKEWLTDYNNKQTK